MNVKELTSQAAEAEGLLKALANRRRLMILCELHTGERSVADLAKAVGLSQSAMSQHLARLREDGILANRREATSVFYFLSDDRAARLIAMLHELYCRTNCGSEKTEPAHEH